MPRFYERDLVLIDELIDQNIDAQDEPYVYMPDMLRRVRALVVSVLSGHVRVD